MDLPPVLLITAGMLAVAILLLALLLAVEGTDGPR